MMKTLLIVRHAHRDTRDQLRDNGLDAQGRKQLKALRKAFRRSVSGHQAHFATSPRRRCVETIGPLAKDAGKPFSTELKLEEQQARETSAQFARRVRKYVQDWRKHGPELLVICTHGDWIPLACRALVGVSIECSKAGFLEIVCEAGQPARLLRLLQSRHLTALSRG